MIDISGNPLLSRTFICPLVVFAAVLIYLPHLWCDKVLPAVSHLLKFLIAVVLVNMWYRSATWSPCIRGRLVTPKQVKEHVIHFLEVIILLIELRSLDIRVSVLVLPIRRIVVIC